MNFDWISFESKEEEATYGHSGLIVECIFDPVGRIEWSQHVGPMDVCAFLERREMGALAQI